ncbi:MAG TPA: hypothetical protein PKC30_02740 [Saprospiraceae bacterium]|nr:hypothetical protein [Saprospiraceae bacterium]
MDRAILYLLPVVLVFLSCESRNSVKTEDRLLAKAGNRTLYLSNVESVFPVFSDSEDSIIFLNNFVDQWIRKTILLEEAEKSLPKDMDINKLVQDYKESLIIHNFEKKVVQERLDTIVSEDEKIRYYQRNRSSFVLNEPIVKAFYAIVPENTSEIREFRNDWVSQKVESMKKYCGKYSLTCSFDQENWILYSDMQTLFPEGMFSDNQLKSGRNLDRFREGNQFFVKILEFRDKNEEAPLEYIEDKIEKIILYNRKIVLLRNMKQRLYEGALELKRVKIYNG